MCEQEFRSRLDAVEAAQVAMAVGLSAALQGVATLNPILKGELSRVFEETRASLLASRSTDNAIQKFDEIAQTILEVLS